jgi:hypothetical protein
VLTVGLSARSSPTSSWKTGMNTILTDYV